MRAYGAPLVCSSAMKAADESFLEEIGDFEAASFRTNVLAKRTGPFTRSARNNGTGLKHVEISSRIQTHQMIFRPEITRSSQLLAWADFQNGLTNKGFRKGCFECWHESRPFPSSIWRLSDVCRPRDFYTVFFSDTGVSGIVFFSPAIGATGGQISMRKPRRNHSAAFKAREPGSDLRRETVAEIARTTRCMRPRRRPGRRSCRRTPRRSSAGMWWRKRPEPDPGAAGGRFGELTTKILFLEAGLGKV